MRPPRGIYSPGSDINEFEFDHLAPAERSPRDAQARFPDMEDRLDFWLLCDDITTDCTDPVQPFEQTAIPRRLTVIAVHLFIHPANPYQLTLLSSSSFPPPPPCLSPLHSTLGPC